MADFVRSCFSASLFRWRASFCVRVEASFSEDDKEDSSSPPARRAILPIRDQFCRAEESLRGKPSSGAVDERGRGAVRFLYWASLIACYGDSATDWLEQTHQKVVNSRNSLQSIW